MFRIARNALFCVAIIAILSYAEDYGNEEYDCEEDYCIEGVNNRSEIMHTIQNIGDIAQEECTKFSTKYHDACYLLYIIYSLASWKIWSFRREGN